MRWKARTAILHVITNVGRDRLRDSRVGGQTLAWRSVDLCSRQQEDLASSERLCFP